MKSKYQKRVQNYKIPQNSVTQATFKQYKKNYFLNQNEQNFWK